MNMPGARFRSFVSPMGVAMLLVSLSAFAQTTPPPAPQGGAPAVAKPAVAKPVEAAKPAPAPAKSAAAPKSAAEPKSAAAAKPVAMADEVDAFDYALLTPGFWAGEHYFEGRADALIPLFDCTERDGMLFFNGRGAWADEGEEEMNLGLVLRRRCLPGGGIVGLNTYYDSRWTREDAHYNQWGAGAEVLTKWIDARANYYLPEHKEEHLGSEEVVTVLDTKTVTRYDQYAVRDQLREKWNAYRYDTLQHDRYDFYAYPMKGYDAEIGALLPLGFQDVEARLFVGYYDFDERSGRNRDYGDTEISGLKGRVELRGWNRLFLDAEIYEDDDLFDSKFMFSARVRVPIGGGEGSADGLLADRLNEMVMRDPHIQIKSGTTLASSMSNEKTFVGKGDVLLLDDVVFAHADRGGPLEDGTAENPYDLIQEAVDKSEAINYPNVYVFGANNPYRENVMIENAVNLYGEGHQFGHGYPGLGVAPVVVGGRLLPKGKMIPPGLFNVFTQDPVLISGFHFAGDPWPLLINSKKADPVPMFSIGVFAESPGALIVQRSRFTDLMAGVVTVFDAPEPGFAIVQDNVFENVGAGVVGVAYSEAGMIVGGNTIQNSLLGVAAVGIGPDADLSALVQGNRILGASSDIGRYVAPDELVELHGGEAVFDAFGMAVPGEWPIPAIAGMAFGAYGGAQVSAGVFDNTVRGPLVGLAGLSLYGDSAQSSDLNIGIYGNTFAGGGFDPIYGLLRNHAGTIGAALIDMLGGPDLTNDEIVDLGTMLRDFLPESLGTDFGLAGILLGSVGDHAELSPVVVDNRVQDYLLGLGLLAADDGRVSDAQIVGNVFQDNFAGILGIAAVDGVIRRTTVGGNTIRVGGTDKLNAILDSIGYGDDYEIPNGGLLGIGFVSIDGSEIRHTQIRGNWISGAAVGVLGAAIYSDIDDFRVLDNTLSDNLLGVVGLAYGSSADIDGFVVRRNMIVGGGVVELIGIADALLGALGGDSFGVDLSLADLGIAGIGLFSLDDADFENFAITDNTIASQAIGIGLVSASFDEDDFSCLDYGVVRDNTIVDVWFGVLGYAQFGHLYELDIDRNTIVAGTDDIVGGILANQVGPAFGFDFTDFPGIAGMAFFVGERGELAYTVVRRNQVDGFIWGFLANATDEYASLDGLTIRRNLFTDNAVGIQVSGQQGASLEDVVIRENEIYGSAFGIIAAIDSDDTVRDTQSYMTVDIIGNTIAGNGNRIGQGFYGLEVLSEVAASDDALDSEKLWFWDGFADMPGDIGIVMPPELTAGGLDGAIPESYFDWEDQTANGFSGVLVSFNGVTEGGRARVRDNAISGYRNGMYAAVQNIDDADPISLRFLENTSAHNILVGDTADYALTQTGAGQDLFLNLFY